MIQKGADSAKDRRVKGFNLKFGASLHLPKRWRIVNRRKLEMTHTHTSPHTHAHRRMPWLRKERAEEGAREREKQRERGREKQRERENMKQVICKGVNHGKLGESATGSRFQRFHWNCDCDAQESFFSAASSCLCSSFSLSPPDIQWNRADCCTVVAVALPFSSLSLLWLLLVAVAHTATRLCVVAVRES